jgi:hypothetical protein
LLKGGTSQLNLHNALHLGLLEKPPELNELHQLLTIALGVEALGLCLHQRRLAQVQVPLSSIELDLLLPQHLIEAEGVPSMGVVHLHLDKVLFLSSLGLCPFGIEVEANLNQGFL